MLSSSTAKIAPAPDMEAYADIRFVAERSLIVGVNITQEETAEMLEEAAFSWKPSAPSL
jgi:hypothetical protein